MINPHQYRLPGDKQSLYLQARDRSDPTNAAAARDALQTMMIQLSDKATARHLARVTGTRINVDLFFGGAALAATGVGAVGSPALARAASATAVGLLGFKSLFGEEVYRNALVHSLVGAIISDRQKIKSDMAASRQKTTLLYSIDDALEDIRTLHDHGSFYYGLTLIKQDVETATLARQNEAHPTNALQRAINRKAKEMEIKNPTKKPNEN